MKTVTKAILMTLATLAAVVFIAFCGTLYWINSDYARDWISSRIDAAIPGAITVHRHHLSLFTPSLDLEGVSLKDKRGIALAGLDRLHAEIDWRSLWRREIRFVRIQLQDPWADLSVEPDMGLNLMAALSAADREAPSPAPDGDRKGRPFNVVVDSIRMTGGRFSFTPRDAATRIEAAGISLSADGDLMARSANLDLSTASLGFNTPEIRPEPARISLKARLEKNRLQVAELDVASGGTRLRLAGSMDDLYATPLIEAKGYLESQLAELKSAFRLAGDYDGPARVELAFKGSMADPQVRLNLTVEGGRIAGQPVDRGDCRITLQDRLMTIDAASLKLADGMVNLQGAIDLREAFSAGLLARPADIDAIAYTAALDVDIPELTPWVRRFIDLAGRTAGRLTLSGQGVTPERISASLTIDGAAQGLLAAGMDRPLDARMKMAARMDRGLLSISRLEAATDSAQLDSSGSFRWADRAVDLNLSLHAEDLSRTLAVVGLPHVRGGGRATLTAKGSLGQPRFKAAVAATGLAVDHVTIGNLTIDADLDPDGRLRLTTLSLENRASRIKGSGLVRLQPQGKGLDPRFVNNLDLAIENLSAADFMPTPPVHGTLDGRLHADGPLAALAAELSLTGSGLQADSLTIGDIDAGLRWQDGTIRIDRLRLNNQGSALSASGAIQLASPGSWHLLQDPTFSLTAASDHVDPADFVKTVSGSFAFNSALAGSLQNPSGRITLAGRKVFVAGQPIHSLALEAHLTERRLWLDRLDAAIVPGQQIDGAGWFGLDKTFDLRLKSEGISVSRIERLRALFPGEGVLRIDVAGKGAIDNPNVEGRLTVADVVINHEAIDDVDITFGLHDGLARARGNLNFEMDAALDLNKGDFEGRLTFDRTEMAAYFKAAGQPAFHGSLTGRIKAAGNIRDVANMSADLDLSHLNLFYKEISLMRSDRIIAGLDGQTLSIPGVELALLSTGRLTLRGDVRIGGQANLAIDGRIPLTDAKVFYEELDGASGMLAFAGTLSGAAADPQVDARIDMEGIGLIVPGLVQKLRNLNGRIYLAGNRIRLDGVKGYLDTGSFQVNGTLEHDHFTPQQVDLAIAARSLPMRIPDTMEVLLNGDITITGKNRTADARGSILLLEGLYYKDPKISLMQITSAATTRQRTVEPVRKPIAIPYFDRVNLDIAVGHRQPFAIENNLAQLEISPDLRIGGSLANPILSGRAQIREGQVIFQKKTFEVQKGIIDFINPYRTEAEIDIQSQAEIRTWRIKLGLKGTPDNLAITLTSDPSENQSDILSLILFGQTSRELTAGEGVAQRTTGQIMTEMIADTFGMDIKKSTGLDILQVETAESMDSSGTDNVKVTMGKHLSDRMTVKYAVETKGGETIRRAITEYKLLEHILVSGFQDNRGIYGSELAFRIEFR